MDEVGKITQIAGVISLSGQDEGIIFRRKHDSSGNAYVWV